MIGAALSILRSFRTISRTAMAPLQFNLIAACDSKMAIGLKNELPWRLRNEMAYFNRMTTGVSKSPGSASGESKKNVVVIGRKTWDSIPVKFRPLKGRINIVVSRSQPVEQINNDEVIWTTSWEEAVEKMESMEMKGEIGKIWIVGGSFIYKLALDSPHCHRIYLTRLHNDYGCDTFFPNFDLDAYQLTKDLEVPEEEQEESGVKYKFFVYEKSK